MTRKRQQNTCRSHSAIGFVGGFTDGYLQKMATQLSLNNSDEHSVMGLVLAVTFEGINDDYMKYFELNNKEQSRVQLCAEHRWLLRL